jgi:ATP synthase protein I
MAAEADRNRSRSRRWARSAPEDGSAALGMSTGWSAFSYLISGMIAYGAIGWGIGKALHAEWPFPVGMIVGLGISVGYVIYRFGRQAQAEQHLSRTKGTGGNDR